MTWDTAIAANQRLARVVAEAKRNKWREAVYTARQRGAKGLWDLERWARLRSDQQPDAGQVPDLTLDGPGPPLATTHEEKARAFASRFFPQPRLEPIDQGLNDQAYIEEGPDRTPFGLAEVREVVRKIGSWKAPGEDGVPTGFVKACGDPVLEAITTLLNATCAVGWFPTRFRSAQVVVIKKPGKKKEDYKAAGGWRPISLLSTVGKILEAAVAARITREAEERLLLPDMQMGNRAHRSTETAVRLLAELVKTAWGRGAIASLLQLDLTGAFDTVDHSRLVQRIQDCGFPAWVAPWVRSFTDARTSQLSFNGRTSRRFQVPTGVPQGSPLSPILFLLYTAPLYERLRALDGVFTIGFADDTNLLAVGTNAATTVQRLGAAWDICQTWATEAGMSFGPAKSSLMHFSRKHAAEATPIRLENATIQPSPSERFLGVWVDRKLNWSAHRKELASKLERQRFALTALAASTWGCSLPEARLLYTQVIRSTIAYGASTYHKISPPKGAARGIARALAAEQSRCLRTVAGAFKATSTRHLETETAVPPLDLYLNYRKRRFEARLEASGLAAWIRIACAAVARVLKTRRFPRRPPLLHDTRWKEDPRTGGDPEKALFSEWADRWYWKCRITPTRRQHHGNEAADHLTRFSKPKKILTLHANLQKHESSALVQLRTGKIGLNSFLYQRRVPSVPSPLCRCGTGIEDHYHVFLHCPLYTEARGSLRARLILRDRRDIRAALSRPRTAGLLVRWFLDLRRITQFELAERLREIWRNPRTEHGTGTGTSRETDGRGAGASGAQAEYLFSN